MKKFLSLVLAVSMLLTLCSFASADAVQEITYSLYSEPDGIDPSITNNSFASAVLANCFEGLMTYDIETGALICGEAADYTVSDDGTVYTFTLREGLKWSDGTTHDANDYVYTVKRILTPETAAKYVSLATDYIAGAAEYYAGETTDFDTVGIKAPDANTVVITLKAPAPYFPAILAMWTFAPVQQATVEANGDRWTASADTYVSNGPFHMAEINMGESFVLVKNDNYYAADSVKLEKVTLRFITDNGTALMAYESGEIDGMNTVPASDYARLKANDPGFVVSPSYGTTYWEFNCSKAPFDNVLVRKAFNLAIDRTALIEDVLQTDAEPAFSFIAPGYVVDGEDFVDAIGDFDLSDEADVEAAQACLAEAGYPNGEGFPEVTLYYYSSDTVKLVAEALAEMLSSNLNISVKIDVADWAVYYDDIVNLNYELGAMGWSGDYLHPMTYLPLLKTGDPNNNVGYSNPEYDALVEQAASMTDAKAAMEVMREADTLASSDYPFLNLYYKSNTTMMNPKVQSFLIDPTGILYLRTAFVAE
ncbi:MAG: peptide ABC transporter substrate-binding protein [Clostridia bacterium]|nr:peptide ABC transporter substrate-binding protein [Clostridia bacterium]